MLNVDIMVQLDGKYIKTITVREDANKSMIETAALKAAGLSYLKARVTHVPGKIANIVPH